VTFIVSPCLSKCKIDRQTRACEGCGRTIDEITRWTKMSDEERMVVMRRLGYGKRKSGKRVDKDNNTVYK